MTTTIQQDPTGAVTPADTTKARQQAMWASGDFAVIGTTLQLQWLEAGLGATYTPYPNVSCQ